MKTATFLLITLILSASLSLTAKAQTEGEPLSGFQLGVAHDLGWGATIKLDRFAFFVGDDGGAVDYRILSRPITADIPIAFYVEVGGYFDWNSDGGVRAPVGVDFMVAKDWTIYAQVVPALRIWDNSDFDVDFSAGFRYRF